MERVKVFGRVVEAIRSVQETSGRGLERITPDTDVYAEIDDFDSLNGIEATVILSASFDNIELSYGLFLPEDGQRDVSVGEIVDRICSLVPIDF